MLEVAGGLHQVLAKFENPVMKYPFIHLGRMSHCNELRGGGHGDLRCCGVDVF